jgi:hypothetical protein
MIRKTLSLYHPRNWAIPFHETDKRWMVLVVHRRAGKTTSAINYLIFSAVKNPGTNYAYIAPTYKMAKSVAWNILKKYTRFPGVIYKESELSVIFPGGSTITLYGAENPDRLRGIGLGGVVFDEYGMQPNNIFTEVIRPTLLDRRGYAIWIGTPKGRNEFYLLYETRKNDDEWFTCHLTVDDTGIIAKKEIEDSKKTMSQEEYMQELYCSFNSSAKGAVYALELARAISDNRISAISWQRDYKVYTVWDIGVGPAMAIGFYQRFNGMVRMIDFWQGTENDGIDQAVSAVKRKEYNYGTHFAPHDINTRETSTGKTRIDYARDLGLSFNIIDSKIGVDNGIQTGKFMFDRLMVDKEKCALWISAISEYKREWDEKGNMFKEIPSHNWTSHAADVHRYAAVVEGKMDNERDDYDNVIPYNPPDYDPYYKVGEL